MAQEVIVLRLIRHIGGNIALTTALLAPVLLAGVSTVLDLSGFYNSKAEVQQALDAAVLAGASSSATDQATMQTVVANAFAANLPTTLAGSHLSTFNFDAPTKTITATSSGTYTPFFGSFVGVNTLQFTVSSTGKKQADGVLEVALVLDNTWSMSAALDATGTKIQVLKTAATNLVNTVMTQANAGLVKIAVVPYADYVNVGTAYRSSLWLSVPADYSVTTPATAAVAGGPTVCTTITNGTTTTCTGGTTETYIASYTDGIPNYATRTVGQTCTTVPRAPYQSCTQSPAPVAAKPATTTNYKWYGCVKNQVSSGVLMLPEPTTAYIGTLATSQKCLNAITPLTATSSQVLAAINALVVNIGSYKPDTYIPGGLTWGVNVLSPSKTYATGAAYDPRNKMPRKVIILMTDGANTQYLNTDGTLTAASYQSGTTTMTTASAAAVAKTYTAQAAACNYAKAKNIEIYTIGFGVTDPTSLSALQSCATDASHYFDAGNSAALIQAFQTIAGKLENVRIAS
jgi:Flp pilus assembly protein TadG